MADPIRAEEVHLRLIADAEIPWDKQFELLVLNGDGIELTILLDGLDVSDILDDARRCGMPPRGPFTDAGLHEDGPPTGRNEGETLILRAWMT